VKETALACSERRRNYIKANPTEGDEVVETTEEMVSSFLSCVRALCERREVVVSWR
jgi:hypothetical protein